MIHKSPHSSAIACVNKCSLICARHFTKLEQIAARFHIIYNIAFVNQDTANIRLQLSLLSAMIWLRHHSQNDNELATTQATQRQDSLTGVRQSNCYACKTYPMLRLRTPHDCNDLYKCICQHCMLRLEIESDMGFCFCIFVPRSPAMRHNVDK